eukprot:Gb_23964 [translate_table: standard]
MSSAIKSSLLSEWPWTNLGALKARIPHYISQYVLYGPMVAKAIHTNFYGGNEVDNWCFHILLLSLLRGFICQLWLMYSNMHALTKKYKICKEDTEFDQIDREWDWDNFILFQAFMATAAHHFLPYFQNLPAWNAWGLLYLVILHMGPAEALFYWVHRAFHKDFLFQRYHSLHHASITLTPPTAGTATFLEHISQTLIMAVPLIGTSLMGGASMGMIYVYCLVFDFLRCMGHCNVEMVPEAIYRYLPPLKYLLYTPSYHALHHTEMDTNLCLFIPLYDYIGHTINPKSWDLHRSIRAGQEDRVPEFVFLAHVVDMLSSLHVRFVFRSFSAIPFSTRWYLIPFWPTSVPVMFAMWAWAKPFVNTSHRLRGQFHQNWVIPRFGFQYFLPFAKNGINNLIENAILSADRMGVKVISLAALNKNEALNGGGTLFVQRLPNLRVRVVHGNTLTAAVILNEIHPDVKEVLLTGATSKLGRAIALYLCQKGIRVMMLTNSEERYKSIQEEAPAEFQKLLVKVTKYQAARNCKEAMLVQASLALAPTTTASSDENRHGKQISNLGRARRKRYKFEDTRMVEENYATTMVPLRGRCISSRIKSYSPQDRSGAVLESKGYSRKSKISYRSQDRRVYGPRKSSALVAILAGRSIISSQTWIVGKWISFREQKWAPPGTHFHQFVVPPIFELRRDCTYGKLAAMQLPDDTEGLSTCEYTLARRCVHACHAGGVLHSLEGWDHHEVGAINVDKIDVVWKAALKHGMKPL